MSRDLSSQSFPSPGCLITAGYRIVPAADTIHITRQSLAKVHNSGDCDAQTTYLYLRGLISLPKTLPGSIENARASCTCTRSLESDAHGLTEKIYETCCSRWTRRSTF